jgi:2'-5' RNA ligase
MRAFLAITPDEHTLAAIADVQRRCRDAVDAVAPHARVSWMRPDALHLTVRFFAAIGTDRAEDLREALAHHLSECEGVDVPLAHIGGFPRIAAPRVLWIGPSDGWMDTADGTRLSVIARAVDHACDSLGLPAEDRRWHPHITLARVKDGERLVGNAVRELGPPPASPTIRADQVTLYRSDPTPAGARHTKVWTVPLLTLPPHRPIADRR